MGESSSKKVNVIQGSELLPVKMKMGRVGPTILAQLGERMIDLLVDSRATGCFIKQELLPTRVSIHPCQQTWTMASMETLKVCS